MTQRLNIDWNQFLIQECYIPLIISAISFSILFVFLYYILAHTIICKYFKHIQQNDISYWTMIESFISIIYSLLLLTLIIIFEKDKLSFSISQQIIDTETTKSERMIASISIGYFIYSILCAIFNKYNTGNINYMLIIDNIVSVIGMTIIIITIHSGYVLIITFFLINITNPLFYTIGIRDILVDKDKNISKSIYLTTLITKRFTCNIHAMSPWTKYENFAR